MSVRTELFGIHAQCVSSRSLLKRLRFSGQDAFVLGLKRSLLSAFFQPDRVSPSQKDWPSGFPRSPRDLRPAKRPSHQGSLNAGPDRKPLGPHGPQLANRAKMPQAIKWRRTRPTFKALYRPGLKKGCPQQLMKRNLFRPGIAFCQSMT